MFRDGWLTEASASNVWIVHEGALLGPPKSEHVLEGIRVELLRELCADVGFAYNLRPVSEAEVHGGRRGHAQLGHQGSAAGHPHRRHEVGHGALRGKPGPVYAKLYEAYQRAKQTMCT
jgi:D-alanine transaminase